MASTVTHTVSVNKDTKASTQENAEFLRSLPEEQVKHIGTFAGIANYHNARKTRALLEACGWNISRAMQQYYDHEGDVDKALTAKGISIP
mmetsp:Transcript_34545/g.63989  ORF Transcript_34545/g.63989 Transcript_34545/m.63989 type:complete len:90 (-) Transcript_34545:212-481(-)